MQFVIITNQHECESSYCITTPDGTPSVCSVTAFPTTDPTPNPTENLTPQYIKFYFGPTEDSMDMFVMMNFDRIKDILWRITKIEHHYWEVFDSWFLTEENTGENQPVVEFQVNTDSWILAKMASLVKLLEFDNTETFKTLFNEFMHSHYGEFSIYMTRVADNYFADLDSWSRYLTQESIINGTVGGGVLYVMMDGIPKLFCNDTVCDFHSGSQLTHGMLYIVLDYVVGMVGDSSGLPYGMHSMFTLCFFDGLVLLYWYHDIRWDTISVSHYPADSMVWMTWMTRMLHLR